MTRRAQETAIWQALYELVMNRNDRRREVADTLGISFWRVKVLRRIAARPSTMRELAASMSTDAPHMTVLVDELERLGLVRREPHPEDRRAKIATLTEEGRQAARKADAILKRPPAALRDLPDEDLAALARITTRLLNDDDPGPG
jgi:DNA-binding MarR family transcriptional regulator